MDFLKKDFGQKLRQAMKERGINQAQLAKLMDVNQSTVSNWCRGEDEPKNDKIHKLFGLLKVDEYKAAETAQFIALAANEILNLTKALIVAVEMLDKIKKGYSVYQPVTSASAP